MSAGRNSRALRNLVVVPRRDLGLEFVNTVAWRGSTPAESLHSVTDVLAWLVSTRTLPAPPLAGLRKWLGAHPKEAAAVFSEVIEVR
jgi:predicted RNA-binding Zn ribbon-like protein